MSKRLLGEILINEGVVSKEKLDMALSRQEKTGKRLGQLLLEMNLINSVDMANALEKEGFNRINLLETEPDWELFQQIEEKFMRDHKIVPYRLENNILYVVISDPYNYQAIDFMRDHFSVLKTEAFVGAEEEIIKTLDKIYTASYFASDEVILEDEDDDGEDDIDAILVENSPIVRNVNEILERAIIENSSDIHFEPQYNEPTRVRYRIDGELIRKTTIQRKLYRQVVSRLKIMAGLDISKKREPQDGRIMFKHLSRTVDMRVSTMPTVNGEKVVIRIFQGNSIIKIDKLEFSDHNLEIVKKRIAKKQGIILATGPTGSGKTTTLYSIMSELNMPNVNVITVEDPVEIKMPGINQTQKTKQVGFSQALSTFLRQDPDILMVGEIRDRDTADIAVSASLTGHLLLSTIHTNDAIGVVTRFIDMGIEPYLIADAVELIISQRLLRRICPKCKEEDPEGLAKAKIAFPESFENVDKIYKGKGCQYCNNLGYKGRIPVHEVIAPDEEIRYLIAQNKVDEIKKLEKDETILKDSLDKVISGKTTFEEVIGKIN
ncbi:MAG: ATPase, T2SS/T4P/T4SS family [Clostridia bacterium]|jgi:type IV pilus assembly protein PilB|nr:ATPase, T2SS/T4P/T4SS family [Clostridia bacterium]